MLTNTTKGYFFAFISVIATSNVYIFSKAALNESSLIQFGVYWFALGFIWNLIFTVYRKKLPAIAQFNGEHYLLLFILGLLEMAGTFLFFLAIYTIPNPAVVSFIGNVNPVFVTVLGFIFLRERFNKWELIGIMLALIGAFTISYTGNTEFKAIFIDGTEYMLLSGLIYSFSTILAKKNVEKLGPSIMALSRTFQLLLYSLVAIILVGESLSISKMAFWNIFIGSGLGPFLSSLAAYQSMKYLEASRISILGSSKGLFVMFGAFLYFNTLPEKHQIIGGLISITGVLLITLGKLMLRRK
jgi:drug/metabolite transporter (DMT)-like permease